MADFDINTNAAAKSSFNTGGSDDSSDTSTGTYRGRRVLTVPNPLSMIEEAAEEVGMEAEERMDRRLEERRGSHGHTESPKKSAMTSLLTGESEAEAEAQAESILDREELEDYVRYLEDHRNSSEKEVLDEAERRFADVSDQYQAMAEAGTLLGDGEENAGLRQALDRAEANLLETSGPAVRAGLNIVEAALALASSGFAPVDEIRDFYRKSILDFASVADLYKKIIQRFGKEKFQTSVEFLLRASGQDLESAGPSISKEQLRSVTDQLYDVEVLGNMHRNLSDLLDRTRELFKQGLHAEAFDLMSEILRLTGERWIRAEDFQQMLEKADIADLHASIYFLTALREQIRLIPLKVYPSTESRGKMLDAAQIALDGIVEKDE
jgi:type III secretion protein W